MLWEKKRRQVCLPPTGRSPASRDQETGGAMCLVRAGKPARFGKYSGKSGAVKLPNRREMSG